MKTGRRDQNLVFGLDIGTRNVVGTVGYKEEDSFYVTAQCVRQHETRSMLDGQIHDIGRVGNTIRLVKEELEGQIDQKLSEVCIAAAGRVLKTVNTRIDYAFQEETVVTTEHIHTMDLLGIEKAQDILNEKNDTRYKFYCVGYSVVKYYLNEEHFISIEGHKANTISEDIIVTFLPEDVVDGLYSAVKKAGMEVTNMTLEPIAAINVAIPETFRMLNLALVDVGAGTSDISITRDGSIIAYGMIPYAGDEITEVIVQNYLVDFKTAEKIKLDSGMEKEVTYKDIMGIEHTIPSTEVWTLAEPVVEKISTEVAAKIKELNGDNSVSATFVVGGGGKIHGFVERLAEKLDIPQERVALRGEEVLQEVIFEQEDIKKDPLLVTPIGICLNYYEQKNNFIMVHFNGERIKLYDNNHLTIVDAAMEAGFPNDQLFPKRGKEINFTVNGKQRIARGEAGESAVVKVNGRVVNINEPLEPNCDITIEPSTAGTPAKCTLEELEEYAKGTVNFVVNGKLIVCPKFMEVNGSMEPSFYEIQEGDVIESRTYYSVRQLAEFMDVKVDENSLVYVNKERADLDSIVYENFAVDWTVMEGWVPEAEEVSTQDVLKNQEDGLKRAVTVGAGVKLQELAAEKKKLEQEIAEIEAQKLAAEQESVHEEESEQEESETSQEQESTGSKKGQTEESTESEVSQGQEGSIEEGTKEDQARSEEKVPVVQTSDRETAGIEAQSKMAERMQGQQPEAIEEPEAQEVEAVEEPEAQEVEAVEEPEAQEVEAAEEPEAQEVEAAEEPEEEQNYLKKEDLQIFVNQQPVLLSGKVEYIFVDIFDFIDFNLADSRGRAIVTTVNGMEAQFSQKLKLNDRVEIYWKEK